MTDPVLVARELWKSYDGRIDVLRGASLRVNAGECSLVWGENGSGKTTLLMILGGMDGPDRGTVALNGQELTALSENARARLRLLQIGFVFQTHRLIEDLTIEENLALPLRLAKRTADARVRELLEAFGLTKLAPRRPGEISVGEAQRVAVARALANGPKVLLADEPTASLDAKGTAAVLEALRLARTRFGTAEVVATHDPEVRALATSEYVLEAGVLHPRA